MRWIVRLAGAAIVAAVIVALYGASGRAAPPSSGQLIGFGIDAHGVRSNGDMAGGGSAGPRWTADGGSTTIRVYKRPEACSLAVDFGSTPISPAPPIFWTFDARLVSHDADSAVVDLTSRREVSDSSIDLSPTPARRRRLTLFEGQPIPLEYATLDQSANHDCDGYLIEAGMHFEDPPEVADARLAYDMWVIFTDSRGNETTQRIESQSGQGHIAEYAFSPLWLDAAGQLSPTGPLGIDVYGTITGRLLADGTVHVSIGAVRFVRDRMRSGTAQAGGKSTNVSLGETIEVQLPPVSGSLGTFGALDSIFRGWSIAVRVTPRRIA